MKKTMLIIFITYLILLWDCKVKYTIKETVYNIEYKGLIWVVLDYWSIWKYNSTDKPMKWLNIAIKIR